MQSLDPMSPLPALQGSRWGPYIHGLLKNGDITLPDGRSIPSPFPAGRTDGNCFQMWVPGFTPAPYPDEERLAHEAQGAWFLPYVLTDGYSFGRLPADAPDFTLAFCLGTNQNMVVAFEEGNLHWWPLGGYSKAPRRTIQNFYQKMPGTEYFGHGCWMLEDWQPNKAILRRADIRWGHSGDRMRGMPMPGGVFNMGFPFYQDTVVPEFFELTVGGSFAAPVFSLRPLPAGWTYDISIRGHSKIEIETTPNADQTDYFVAAVYKPVAGGTMKGGRSAPQWPVEDQNNWLESHYYRGANVVHAAGFDRITTNILGYVYRGGAPTPIILRTVTNVSSSENINGWPGDFWRSSNPDAYLLKPYIVRKKQAVSVQSVQIGNQQISAQQTLNGPVEVFVDNHLPSFSQASPNIDQTLVKDERIWHIRLSNSLLLQSRVTMFAGKPVTNWKIIDLAGQVLRTGSFDPVKRYPEWAGTDYTQVTQYVEPGGYASKHPATGQFAYDENMPVRWV